MLLFLINYAFAYNECFKKENIKNLKEINIYFSKEPFTRCDYNGKLINCNKYKNIIKLKKDKNIDPNLKLY